METLLPGPSFPDEAHKALASLQACLDDGRHGRRLKTRCHAILRTLGAVLAEACWMRGHAAGVRRKMPAEGRTRIDLSLTEQLQLVRLANVGFQYMMPNVRLIDAQRFSGQDDALNASRAISRIELTIPAEHRPDVIRQLESRDAFISDWWGSVNFKAA